MKNYVITCLLLLLLIGCNDDERKAKEMLGRAEQLYENRQYELVRHALDSIKASYPKQIKVLKDGLQLMRQVDLKEQERNIVFCDSMLLVREAEADSMKKLFVYEKDPEYDDIGKYVDKQQVLERNLQRSYIRSGVNELGELYIASVYYGSGRIRHQQMKVTAPDNTYAETAVISEDGGLNYAFEDLGMTTEVVTYQKGGDNNVALFIYNLKDTRLKAELIGRKPYSFTISDGDKKSLAKTYDFSIILSDIERLKKEKEKAESRIIYLQLKLEERTPE